MSVRAVTLAFADCSYFPSCHIPPKRCCTDTHATHLNCIFQVESQQDCYTKDPTSQSATFYRIFVTVSTKMNWNSTSIASHSVVRMGTFEDW
jgi:hypothetical protein